MANQSQILCGASMGREDETLSTISGSHDQDGNHTNVCMVKINPSKIFFGTWTNFHETWYVAFGTWAIIVCSNDNPRLTLTYFKARLNCVTQTFFSGKSETMSIAVCDM